MKQANVSKAVVSKKNQISRKLLGDPNEGRQKPHILSGWRNPKLKKNQSTSTLFRHQKVMGLFHHHGGSLFHQEEYFFLSTFLTLKVKK